MAKILTKEDYLALKSKADNYDALIQAVVEANEGIKADELAVDDIKNLITAEKVEDTTEDVSGLKQQVTDLEELKVQLEEKVSALTTEIEELKKTPADESVTDGKPKTDAGAADGDDEDALLAFALKNKGNTLAIAQEMEKYGYGK